MVYNVVYWLSRNLYHAMLTTEKTQERTMNVDHQVKSANNGAFATERQKRRCATQ